MGKGDRRTRRGKIFAASYGNSRKQSRPVAEVKPTTAAKVGVAPVKKATPAKKAKSE